MSIFKCKMCGGDLEISEGITVCDCDYCGTKQTVPTAKDENLHGLYNRANTLRIKAEFDKAEQLYEKILQVDESQAEAYWGLILCKYGIEYVEDPATFKRVPTCHRTSFDSIIADEDYKSALKYADAVQKSIYEQEAKEIDRIQKEIIELSSKEEPYDVFICYKETDITGSRTQDSVIANDIYYQLTNEGFKVFYAAITLEDKLGSAYEPCIFAALNSAKVMLTIGTKSEYFNAVWVKNEWSRFLKMMKTDRSKMLIPCYKDMDAYDLPGEFAHLQAQDMGKIGFINDIVRGIKKVVSKEDTKPAPVVNVVSNTTTEPLLKRAFIFLEDGDWDSANEYCEKVLDLEPECAEAYLGKLMAELHISKAKQLKNLDKSFENNSNYIKIIRYADDKLKKELMEYASIVNEKAEEARKDSILSEAKSKMFGENIANYESAIRLLKSIPGWKDSNEIIVVCSNKIKTIKEKTEEARKDSILSKAKSKMVGENIADYECAIQLLESIAGWKDSNEKVTECKKCIETLKIKEEQKLLEQQRKDEQDKIKAAIRKKRKKRVTLFITSAISLLLAVAFVLTSFNFTPWKDIEKIYTGRYAGGSYYYIKKDATLINDDYTSEWKDVVAIESGYCVAGLKKDGTVVIGGDSYYLQNFDVSNWKDIVEISMMDEHLVGLKSDGTVVAVGENEYGQCNVSEWKDIVTIEAGRWHTVGVKSDGTIVFSGDDLNTRYDISDWKNIKYVLEKGSHIVGLRKDGTVVAKGIIFGDNEDKGQCDVSEWKDIIAIDAGEDYTVGLKSDGTVVATGTNKYGQCNVKDWTDIVAISANAHLTVGLKSNGTVVWTGSTESQINLGERDVRFDEISTWTDIVSVLTNGDSITGLKSDGTIVNTEDYSGGVWQGFFGSLIR